MLTDRNVPLLTVWTVYIFMVKGGGKGKLAGQQNGRAPHGKAAMLLTLQSGQGQ